MLEYNRNVCRMKLLSVVSYLRRTFQKRNHTAEARTRSSTDRGVPRFRPRQLCPRSRGALSGVDARPPEEVTPQSSLLAKLPREGGTVPNQCINYLLRPLARLPLSSSSTAAALRIANVVLMFTT